ncbi:D-alanyl-D-alanine carboxypeptidase family protein [Oribacterium sp. WCC10]|uniref:D-alanyl-D-alanine carboxypeptidase family protein n=1 Tax=Oribacterium sp. WCC10 TaxID=1855343 RepID=UPI001586FE08|nr:serine hydrolase [Oribacterium sp. WCC10]
MKSYKKYIKKTAAEILIAVMASVSVSTVTLADTATNIVEISDNGPVVVSETGNSASLESYSSGPSIESTTAVTETTAAASTASVNVSPDAGVTTVTGTTVDISAPTGTSADSANVSVQPTGSGQAVTDTQSTAITSASSNGASSVTVTVGTGTASTTGTTGTSTDSTNTTSTTVNYFQNTGSATSFLKTSLTASPEVNANFAILVDSDANLVVADKNGEAKMYPASMTKVMTLLVACEHITDLNETVEITQDIVDYVYANDASNCGFKAGEKVTVQDLLYGLILPSGADAALALVRHIAGSEDQFVNLMNQKAQELGISATTHYTNCTGLYNDNHYTTARDMALVMKYAAANPYASAVLSTRTYTTKPNNKRSTGITFSNLFLKRIDTQSTGGQAVMAKTGYVSKAGNCAVSYFTGASGKHYILVTGKTTGAWNVVYAHAELYKKYAL